MTIIVDGSRYDLAPVTELCGMSAVTLELESARTG